MFRLNSVCHSIYNTIDIVYDRMGSGYVKKRNFNRHGGNGWSMTDGWFAGLDPGDEDALAAAIRDGTVEMPAAWPAEAVDAGFAADESDYYVRLHEATMAATRKMVQKRERADDQQLIHAIRAMDDCDRTANELAERTSGWAGSLLDADEFDRPLTGVDGARRIAEMTPDNRAEKRMISLARQVVSLADEAEDLRSFIEQRTPAVAPNLAAMAGPVLAARLIALAGGLKQLARMPSGTVQVLGAEDALFAHLRGHADSPKHGIIFVHEYVGGTHPDERGSAARALAGKLSIAARVYNYSCERRPELDTELDERIDRIRSRRSDDE